MRVRPLGVGRGAARIRAVLHRRGDQSRAPVGAVAVERAEVVDRGELLREEHRRHEVGVHAVLLSGRGTGERGDAGRVGVGAADEADAAQDFTTGAGHVVDLLRQRRQTRLGLDSVGSGQPVEVDAGGIAVWCRAPA